MQVITRLWRAGTVGRAAVVFVALLLGCCMLGALGSLLTPSTTRQRTASEQPTPTILSGSPSVAAPTTAPSTEPPPATAQPTLSASPTLAPSIIPTAPPAPSPIPTVLPTPSPVPSPTSAGADIPAAPAAAPGGSPSLVQPAGLPTAAVVEVIDGDTVDVRINSQVVRIRLIGIDTPEVVDPRRPVECFGREASAKAHELLDGQTVAFEADPSQDDRDRYGRSLRYLWLPDGRLFNLEMIAQGYAFEYTYNVPYQYQQSFKQAEQDARAQQRGLWSPATCNGEPRPADVAPAPTAAPPPPPADVAPAPTAVPVAPPAPTAASEPAGNCDPSYPDVCIPPPPPDLDCGDIPYRNFRVLPPDPHRFDRDKDGIGCET